MIIASCSGRLLPADKKIKGSFRWMGSKCCVVQASGSSRRRNEGGSTPRSHPRGRKRRGTRSKRGGVRKRRALVGAALDTSSSPPTQTSVRNRSVKRRERVFEYAFRHIFFAEDKFEALERINDDRVEMNYVHKDGETKYWKISKLQTSIHRHLRRWRQIRKETFPGEPAFSREMALEGFLGSDFRRKLSQNMLRLLSPAGGGVIPEAVETAVNVRTQKSAQASGHPYWCSKCLRSTNVKVCRKCGGSLAKSTHEKGVGERKRLVISERPQAPPTQPGPKGKGKQIPTRFK